MQLVCYIACSQCLALIHSYWTFCIANWQSSDPLYRYPHCQGYLDSNRSEVSIGTMLQISRRIFLGENYGTLIFPLFISPSMVSSQLELRMTVCRLFHWGSWWVSCGPVLVCESVRGWYWTGRRLKQWWRTSMWSGAAAMEAGWRM